MSSYFIEQFFDKRMALITIADTPAITAGTNIFKPSVNAPIKPHAETPNKVPFISPKPFGLVLLSFEDLYKKEVIVGCWWTNVFMYYILFIYF